MLKVLKDVSENKNILQYIKIVRLFLSGGGVFSASLIFIPTLVWFLEYPKWLPWKGFLHSLPGMFFILIPFLFGGCFGKVWLWLVWLIFSSAAAFHAGHIILYNVPVSAQTMSAIVETNPAEAAEFIQAYLSPELALVIAACYVLPLFFIKPLLRSCSVFRSDKKYVACFLLAIAVVVTAVRTPYKIGKYNPLGTIGMHYARYMEHRASFATLPAKDIKSLSQYGIAPRDDTPLTMVVVVGESAVRNHHGYYGYSRKTSPFMEARAKELFIFKDMISAAFSTAQSHEKMLMMPVEKGRPLLPLMHMLAVANMETCWMTTQYAYDPACSPMPFQAEHFININSSVDASQYYDESILPYFKEFLTKSAGKSRLIFLNIMGSHVVYDSRYPAKFSTFTGKTGMTSPYRESAKARKIINAYDNSVLYTDFILEELIRSLEGVPNSALLYLSDHGQEVYDRENRFGHAPFRPVGVEIPFFLWMSPSFQDWRGRDEVAFWRTCVDRPGMTDSLGYMLADILDMKLEDSNRKYSVFSRDFEVRPRIVGDMNYDQARHK